MVLRVGLAGRKFVGQAGVAEFESLRELGFENGEGKRMGFGRFLLAGVECSLILA